MTCQGDPPPLSSVRVSQVDSMHGSPDQLAPRARHLLRTLIARLPLLANKDLPFAAAAALLIGEDNALTNVIALTATLTFSAHLLVGIGLVAGWGWGKLRARAGAPA